MINQILLVGRLTKTPELFLTESGKKGSFITLAVGRPFKNLDGEYETDFLDCTLWTGIAESTAEYCKFVVGFNLKLSNLKMELNIKEWKSLLIKLHFYHQVILRKMMISIY